METTERAWNIPHGHRGRGYLTCPPCLAVIELEKLAVEMAEAILAWCEAKGGDTLSAEHVAEDRMHALAAKLRKINGEDTR